MTSPSLSSFPNLLSGASLSTSELSSVARELFGCSGPETEDCLGCLDWARDLVWCSSISLRTSTGTLAIRCGRRYNAPAQDEASSRSFCCSGGMQNKRLGIDLELRAWPKKAGGEESGSEPASGRAAIISSCGGGLGGFHTGHPARWDKANDGMDAWAIKPASRPCGDTVGDVVRHPTRSMEELAGRAKLL